MDDLEFIQRCVQGNRQSWDEFVDKYSRLIYNYIHSVIKLKGSSAAQGNINDIFQELFLSLVSENFKKLKSFKAKNGCSLASWLRQVTINFTLDYMRKARILVSLDEEDADGLSIKDILSDGSAAVSDSLVQEEKLGSLTECIDKLEPQDKYFIEMHISRGLSLEQLKGFLNISRGAVDMRKVRIIEKLKDCFRKKGFALDS